MILHEIRSRHIIGKSGLGPDSKSVNSFIGCSHACVYCYAVFMRRLTDHTEPWGQFLDVKINAGELFPADYRRLKDGETLFFGSVTDVYQPAEKRFGLMRRILEFLAGEADQAKRSDGKSSLNGVIPQDPPRSPTGSPPRSRRSSRSSRPTAANYFPEMIDAAPDWLSVSSAPLPPTQPVKRIGLTILTKSDLILRDLDLIRRIPSISVGFSLAMPDDRAARIFEPGASPPRARLAALAAFHQAGIPTFVFVNPVLPHITPIETIFSQIASHADSVFGESLNLRCGNLPSVCDAVRRYDPTLVPLFRRDIRNENYWTEIRNKFNALAEQYGILSEGFHLHRS